MYTQNLSPEKRKGCSVTAKADVYAAGWVFFEVLCGLSPLLFREAKSNDDFAASRVTLPCLLCVYVCVCVCVCLCLCVSVCVSLSVSLCLRVCAEQRRRSVLLMTCYCVMQHGTAVIP